MNPQPESDSGPRVLRIVAAVGGGLILLLVALFAVFTSLESKKVAPAEPQLATIRPTVKVSLTELTVTNNDASAYEQVRIVLNPSGLTQRGYTARAVTIHPNGFVTVPLIEFADSDGRRFQPLQTKVQRVNVFARVEGKDAVAVLSF